jgi:DNA-binding MarR family transcriptional regulator
MIIFYNYYLVVKRAEAAVSGNAGGSVRVAGGLDLAKAINKAIKRKSEPTKPQQIVHLAASDRGAVNFGPLQEDLGYVLRRAQLVIFQRFFETFAAFDIRPAQYSVLTVIELNPGISQAQAADALGIKRPNFVAMIDTLEERRLAQRVPAENDRRFHGLYLTDDGRALMGKLHKIAATQERVIVDRLGATEYRRLRESLRVVAEL